MILVQVIPHQRKPLPLGLERFRGPVTEEIPPSLKIVFSGVDTLPIEGVRGLFGWDKDTVAEELDPINPYITHFRTLAGRAATFKTRRHDTSLELFNAPKIELVALFGRLDLYGQGLGIAGWREAVTTLTSTKR